ncbi:uncharacterized protein [Zea mays]|uniref:uncharacterized protein isoform X2 n=1 Tax=Zea mays TaxID=4577 RepID=UPI0004DE9D7D|nr:uncharacterized protein LOC103627507 isoform X2 [Zea mays]|eukprot:XP_008646018.1 uncharacterized protein LOC103627507 isoform X2 [Zea mays]
MFEVVSSGFASQAAKPTEKQVKLQREYQIKYLLSLSFFIKSFLGGFKCTIPWFGERREDEGAGTSQSILEARQTHPLLLLKVKMHKMI